MPTPTISWAVDADGDWSDASDWSPQRQPDDSDNVSIDTTDLHTITHSAGTDTVHTLTVGNDDFVVSGGALNIETLASFANDLTISGGTLSVLKGSLTCQGALALTGGTLKLAGASATVAGFSEVSASILSGPESLKVTGAATISTADGGALQTGTGTTTLEGATSLSGGHGLYLDGDRVLENLGVLTDTNHTAIVLGDNPFGASLGGGSIQNEGTVDLKGVATIAYGGGEAVFVNGGTFEQTDSAGQSYVAAGVSFSNTGLVAVKTGALAFDGNFVNGGPNGGAGGGTVTVAAGATLAIGAKGSTWSNAGTITATKATVDLGGVWGDSTGVFDISDCKLNLAGAFSTAQLAPFDDKGDALAILAGGMMNNAGASLQVGPNTALGAITLAGWINGGSITENGGGLLIDDGTLNGVTLIGALDLTSTGATLNVGGGGLIIESATGRARTLPAGNPHQGAVQVSGTGSGLDFLATQIFNNATIDIGSSSAADDGTAEIAIVPPSDATRGVLTLGAGVIIDQTGDFAALVSGGNTADLIISKGVIDADLAGGTFIIDPLNFTNQGSVSVANGDTLIMDPDYTGDASNPLGVDYLQPGVLTNLKGGVLTGGVWRVGAGSTLDLPENAPIVTCDATLILSGAGSVVQSLDTTTSQEVTLDASLTTIDKGGALELLANRGWTSSQTISNTGVIQLDGGAFTATALHNEAGATFQGSGVVGAAVNNVKGGVIEVSGGTLEFTADVTGAGVFTIAGGKLWFDASFGGNIDFSGSSGVLELAQSHAYSGTVAGFSTAGTTTFDLEDIAFTAGVTKASYSGTTSGGVLTVTNGTDTAHIHLTGNYLTSDWTLKTDGHGGTTVTDPEAAGPPAARRSQGFIAAACVLGAAGESRPEAPANTRVNALVSTLAVFSHV